MNKKIEEFPDYINRLYPEFIRGRENSRVLSRTITFQVTDACNLQCSYCYQINKGHRKMPFEYAQKLIDDLLEDKTTYCNKDNSPGIILEFIGGEPLLEVELIDKIIVYFQEKAFQLKHPWAYKYRISISTNGTLYFNDNVQRFLNKHKNHLSLSISIDGNKELHDSCRKFPDGTGSYDLANAAAQDWMAKGNDPGTKITICPENLQYLDKALECFIQSGNKTIFANTVYEQGWTLEHAKIFYKKLKYISDYLLNNNLNKKITITLFDPILFKPLEELENENWCGGTGYMLALDPDGYYYPCLRYMESSIGKDQKPIRLGHCNTGIGCTEKDKETIKCLECITRRSQSTDECFYCPIGRGCGWCSAYNYQLYGTPNKRATFICNMHKARSLANVYYWNKQGIHMDLNCPKEWALEIISEEEYNMLQELANSTL